MISGSTMMLNMDPAIINALREDVTSEDVSTNAIMRQPQLGKAELICKQDGIICGLDVFARVFEILEEEAHFETTYADGDEVKKGQLIGVIYADIRTLLTGERTALNFLQRMSGIATNTNKMVRFWKASTPRCSTPERQHRVCVSLKSTQYAAAAQPTTATICPIVS